MNFLENVFLNGDIDISKIIIIAFIFLLIILNVFNCIRIKKIKKDYHTLINGTKEENLEKVLLNFIEETKRIKKENLEIEKKLKNIKEEMMYSIQKVGMIKYDAFDNMGSELSFSIALLDALNSGIIITELYSRDSSALYVKAINNGVTDKQLSEEEEKAIKIAQENYKNKKT